MDKKLSVVIFAMIILLPAVFADLSKIEIFTMGEEFGAGNNITLKVSLLDENSNPINKQIFVVFEDSIKNQITKDIQTNEFVEVSLGENTLGGMWKIIAEEEEGEKATTIFSIKEKEMVNFELNEDILKITNTGNTFYNEKIQVAIGDTIGEKTIELNIGESAELRLIAPNGVYNVKVSDGKTTGAWGEVSLTGGAIGILNKKTNGGSLITSISPENVNAGAYSFTKSSSFLYIFVFCVISTTILLAIERHYRKKLNN
ncbi:MAG: hypothetical protein WC533_04660 [Candidatus Pacearchaeota archaeon]